jgi:hypothetical protein
VIAPCLQNGIHAALTPRCVQQSFQSLSGVDAEVVSYFVVVVVLARVVVVICLVVALFVTLFVALVVVLVVGRTVRCVCVVLIGCCTVGG